MGKKKEEKKKYKNMKVEPVELTPIAIGAFENRKKSSVSIFIIMTIFILVIIFLPNISSYINAYLNPEAPISNEDPPNKVTPSVPEDPEEETFYAYASDLKIINEDITVSNFSVNSENHILSYTITNNSNGQDIEGLNYYLEIYNSEKTLLERVKLASELTLANGAFRTLTKNIGSDTASQIGYLVLLKKTVQEYPEVELQASEDGTTSLVCSSTNEVVHYKFKDNKLQELTSEINYTKDISNYDTMLSSQKILVNTYNNKNGVVSTLFEYESGYNITTTVNLSSASRFYVFNADTFIIDTEAKVVKFEMEAQGFQCE